MNNGNRLALRSSQKRYPTSRQKKNPGDD